MSAITVFISYSHDSDEHREMVLALSERLRKDGIDTRLDQYVNGSPEQGWPRWMLDQLDAANSVLIVCTETYYRRFRGHEVPNKGKGVDWEGALITQDIYDSRSRTLKFVPVFLSDAVEEWIPDPLRSGTHYTLTSASAYKRLYDFLLGVAGVEARPIGTLTKQERRTGTTLSFNDEGGDTVSKRPVDISRIIKYAPAELVGREAETKLLSDAWDKAVRSESRRPHVLTFVALGGEGKTSLIAKWAAELAHQDWPGCDAVFAWSFYHQGTDEKTADSSDLFLKEALTVFGDPEMAGSARGAFDKGRRLAQLVGERRALLILDGLEPLQYAPTSPTPGELKDQGLAALLKGLASTSRGLCVVTTRYAIPDLRAFLGKGEQEEKLTSLSTEAGVVLLRFLGVKGAPMEFAKLVEDVKGHALALNLLGSFLRNAHAGDIRKRDLVKLEEADSEEQGGHAFRVMDAYVESLENGGKTPEDNARGRRALALLWLLGLFDRPATADCLNALWKGEVIAGLTEPLIGISEPQRNMSLQRLEAAKLLTVNRDAAGTLLSLDAHPLVREYFARLMREQQTDIWCAAHRRIYKHLCATTPDKDEPSLDDLQPLYQAVAHGCQAGLQQEVCDEVYFGRIKRGPENYTVNKLGAFGSELGAIACFFASPWSRVSLALTENDQGWLLNEAAFVLRALGRLTEALEPMRANLKIRIEREDWKHAPSSASNLSELELALGAVADAVRDAEQSVIYADRTDHTFQQFSKRCTHANALHQAGRRAEANARFREAEQMQVDSQPHFPRLYSLRGFQYCDILLTEAERAGWQVTLQGTALQAAAFHDCATPSLPDASVFPIAADHRSVLLQACRAVSERAEQTLEWGQTSVQASILDIALNYLTLGQAALYAAILEWSATVGSLQSPNSALTSTDDKRRSGLKAELQGATQHLDAAVDALRRSGTMDHFPRGLLTRAWLRSLTGMLTAPENARSDLDEAWEIAERGPMPLFLADIRLHRARLFFREAKYPWESPQSDLAEARRLIEKHGYWRRKEELEDAEAVINKR